MPTHCETQKNTVEAKTAPTHLNGEVQNTNTAEADLRQDKFYPSLPGFNNPVVQNSDTNQEASQGATEVAHIPGAIAVWVRAIA